MRNNLWLTGIGAFTALLFGFLAYFNWRIYAYRQENYYLAGMLVFGMIAVLSVYAVINGWRNALPGQSRGADELAESPPDDEEP